jgi:hypothetical protein
MSANTALVTDTAKANAQQQLDDYAGGVAGHTTGDWAQHRQARLYGIRFTEPVSGDQVALNYLRLRLTKAGTDYTVKIPAIATAAVPVEGAAPVVYLQPVSLVVAIGSPALFTVGAASTSTPAYQWKKNGVNITGATSSSLFLSSCQTTDQATYTVVVTNVYGSTTSGSATLTVSS